MSRRSDCTIATTTPAASAGVAARSGNTVLVVEHDEETIRRADYVIDLARRRTHGGEVVASERPTRLKLHRAHLPAIHLWQKQITYRHARRRRTEGITILGQREQPQGPGCEFSAGLMTV